MVHAPCCACGWQRCACRRDPACVGRHVRRSASRTRHAAERARTGNSYCLLRSAALPSALAPLSATKGSALPARAARCRSGRGGHQCGSARRHPVCVRTSGRSAVGQQHACSGRNAVARRRMTHGASGAGDARSTSSRADRPSHRPAACARRHAGPRHRCEARGASQTAGSPKTQPESAGAGVQDRTCIIEELARHDACAQRGPFRV